MRGGTSGEWNVTQLPQGEITFRSIEFTETSERIGEIRSAKERRRIRFYFHPAKILHNLLFIFIFSFRRILNFPLFELACKNSSKSIRSIKVIHSAHTSTSHFLHPSQLILLNSRSTWNRSKDIQNINDTKIPFLASHISFLSIKKRALVIRSRYG